MLPKYIAYTDGGCYPNPGNGAWAYVVMRGNTVIEQQSGFESNTTNNRMEYLGLIKVLEKYDKIVVCSDSQLLVNTVNKWMHSWFKRGWKKKGGSIKNLDLVQKLHRLYNSDNHEVKWVKGHSGILGNELADELCTKTVSLNTGMSIPELNSFWD